MIPLDKGSPAAYPGTLWVPLRLPAPNVKYTRHHNVAQFFLKFPRQICQVSVGLTALLLPADASVLLPMAALFPWRLTCV